MRVHLDQAFRLAFNLCRNGSDITVALTSICSSVTRPRHTSGQKLPNAHNDAHIPTRRRARDTILAADRNRDALTRAK